MVTFSGCTNYGQNLVGGLDSFLQNAVFYNILTQLGNAEEQCSIIFFPSWIDGDKMKVEQKAFSDMLTEFLLSLLTSKWL